MKIVFVLLSFYLLVTSCSYFQEKPSTSEPKQVAFVINDESASISWDQKSKTIREQYLKKTLYKQLQPPTDIIYMAIHSKSNAASNQRMIAWEEESVDTDPEQQKLQSISQVLSYFESPMSRNSEQQSSEIIELTAEIVRLSSSSSSYKSVSLCYVGDLEQESLFRNFRKTPLSDKRTAQRMAKDDAQKLCQEYGLNRSALKKVISIEMLLPPNNLGMENLQHYYDAFFKTLGYKYTVHWTVVR